MTPTKPHHVTLAQWLAVAVVWGLVGYGLVAGPKAEARRDRMSLAACAPNLPLIPAKAGTQAEHP
ncbi:hypothetical protein EV278_108189 [Caulobacter sp. BK020]|nr:hypothetical protein EV278_108189 [Caulobacter sp. BK020]